MRAEIDDFRVEEIPSYTPAGSGDHLYIRFEKRGLNTQEAVKRLARVLDVTPRDAGWAGLKDRHAVTRQWASFEHADRARLVSEIEGVTVLETAYHGNKLRTGHLRGNRFSILLRGADPSAVSSCRAVLEQLSARGLPAYFGPQRFGRDGLNLVDAVRWVVEDGRSPRDRFRRKMLVSALQSAIFNELLADRVRRGLLDKTVQGDLLRKVETGGLFVSPDAEVDTARAQAFEVSATGPMFGAKMRWPEGEALAIEEAALERWGLTREILRGFKKSGAGTRRPYRFPLREASAEPEDHGVRVEFTLPAGAYATVVLRELLRAEVR